MCCGLVEPPWFDFHGVHRDVVLWPCGERAKVEPVVEQVCWWHRDLVRRNVGTSTDTAGATQGSSAWDWKRRTRHTYGVRIPNGGADLGDITGICATEQSVELTSFSYLLETTAQGANNSVVYRRVTKTAVEGGCVSGDANKFCVTTRTEEWDYSFDGSGDVVLGAKIEDSTVDTEESSLVQYLGTTNFTETDELENAWTDAQLRADVEEALSRVTEEAGALTVVGYEAPLKVDYDGVPMGSCPHPLGVFPELRMERTDVGLKVPTAADADAQGREWDGDYYAGKWEWVFFPEGWDSGDPGAPVPVVLSSEEEVWTGGSRELARLGDVEVPAGEVGQVEVRNAYMKGWSGDVWHKHPNFDLWEP